jgi:aspartate aminotransferase-like enzyme
MVMAEDRDPRPLLAYCKECGVVLGQGIGALSGKSFRIAHMGHLNAPMVLGTLGVIEMALGARHPAPQRRRPGRNRLARRKRETVMRAAWGHSGKAKKIVRDKRANPHYSRRAGGCGLTN